MSEAAPVWEILALRYAHHARKGRENFLNPAGIADLHDTDMPLDYYVWVLRRGVQVVVVDTGFGRETAAARGRTLLCPVPEALASVGVDAASVADVVITHLHYDHAGSLGAFARARFHLQDGEMAFATGRCMGHAHLRAPFEVEDVVTMVRRVYDGRVVFVDGDREILPGISLHRVPGHTPGLQCVRVMTARGAVVLASDACHLYANMERGNPFPIVTDVPAMMASWQRLADLAASPDHIVPGHDPQVLARYPRADTCVPVALLHEAPRVTKIGA